jgi:uncharacterized protein YbjQ (UPF0145 family)
VFCLLVTPSTALARTDFLDLAVGDAKGGELGQAKLLDVPFYMAGQSHPSVARSYGVSKSNRRTNAFGKSDEQACEVAFLSAIIALQQRARAQGGNAVIDIRSVTKGNELSSSSKYRCAVGFAIANVALEGRVVKLAR